MSSSRRSSGDVNILAMLDGLGTRPQARRTLLWYGVGGVLACALVGTLAWMVHDAAPDAEPSTVAVALPAPLVTKAGKPAEFAAAPAPAAVQAAPAVPDAALPAPAPSGGATIVNLPSVSGAEAPALAAGAGLADEPHVAPAPKHPSAHAAAPKTAAARQPPARTSVAAKPAAHPSSRRLAAGNRPTAPTAMDTDVALISAIIRHAANQGNGADEGGCGDKPCAPRTPARP